MNYFITKANFIRMSSTYKIEEKSENLPIYRRQIKFFSKIEENQIMSVKQFLIHCKDDLVTFTRSGFIKDTYSFVKEQAHHAKYHVDENCSCLSSVYRDLEIPVEIKYKNGSDQLDIEAIENFRAWFKSGDIEELYYNNQIQFIYKMQLKFNLTNPPKPVELNGSGIQRISNFSEKDLEEKIDDLIRKASEFYNKSQKNRDILVNANFSKMTYYVTSKKYYNIKIDRNNTIYSDSEIRELLVEFYQNIKKPLINYLVDYWILKLNPKLDFNENILDQLDFEPCKKCSGVAAQYIYTEDVDDCEPIFF